MTIQDNSLSAESASKNAAHTVEVMRVLAEWGLSSEAQMMVLGLQGQARRREVLKFQSGQKPLPDNQDTQVRAEHILGIASALSTAYPSQREAGANWMGQRNQKLRGRTPLQCILQDGQRGLVRVRSTVDCAWGWHQDDTNNPCWSK